VRIRVGVPPDVRSTWLSRALSVIVHGSLLVWLLWPDGEVRSTPTAYEQLVKGHEQKILLYKFRDELPDVKPPEPADSRPPKAEVKTAKQSIIASPKNAPKERQIVVMAAPEMPEPPKLDSPNLLALQPAPPAPPERKKFAPEAAKPKIVRDLAKPKTLDAPEMLAADPTPDKFLENLGAVPKLTQSNRPKFVVPAAKVKTNISKVKEFDAAPPPVPGAMPMSGPNFTALNMAVVGINPGPKDAPLPDASHAAQFSAGPELNPNGGAGAGNPNASLTVPDLVVRGSASTARATEALLAANRVAPTSMENLAGLSKYAAPAAPEPEPDTSGATRVSSAPNPRFDGKEVYSMAIQMPNITSYSGSWLMWYAAQTSGMHIPVAPPVPIRKVDPKYIATAVAERVEGTVRLLCVVNQAGRVEQVELVKGLDPRLDQSAMEALAKWIFRPASRRRLPVDVDVMVEIPFRLAPKEIK